MSVTIVTEVDGVDVEEDVPVLSLTLGEYDRALSSICRCEDRRRIECVCTDEQIMTAHERLTEQDGHAARTRSSMSRRRRR